MVKMFHDLPHLFFNAEPDVRRDTWGMSMGMAVGRWTQQLVQRHMQRSFDGHAHVVLKPPHTYAHVLEQKEKKKERQKRQKEYEQAEKEGLEPPPKRIPKVSSASTCPSMVHVHAPGSCGPPWIVVHARVTRRTQCLNALTVVHEVHACAMVRLKCACQACVCMCEDGSVYV